MVLDLKWIFWYRITTYHPERVFQYSMVQRVIMSHGLPIVCPTGIEHSISIRDVVSVVWMAPDRDKQAQSDQNGEPHADCETDTSI